MIMQNKMLTKGMVFGIILLFVGASNIAALNVLTTQDPKSLDRSNWLYVGGSGPGNYTTIQSAIDAASNGDTVFVYDDSSPYYESVIVDKSIDLLGEDKNSTFIDGGGTGDAIHISVDNVNISGLTIMNSNSKGIYIVTGSNIRITGNKITNNNIGVQFQSAGDSNYIIENDFSNNNDNGIYLSNSDETYIISNTLTSLGNYGIHVQQTINCHIIDNELYEINSYAIYIHENSDQYEVTNNTIYCTHHTDVSIGIFVRTGTDYGIIANNTITDKESGSNNYGIFVRDTDNPVYIYNNNVIDCDRGIGNSYGSNRYVYNNSVYATLNENYYPIYGGQNGIELSTDYSLANNNTITGFEDKALFVSGDYCEAYNNTIINAGCGLEIYGSYLTISYNTIIGICYWPNINTGIYERSEASNNYYYRNKIVNRTDNESVSGTFDYSAMFIDGSNSQIIENHVEHCDEGVRIYGNNHRLSRNNFIDCFEYNVSDLGINNTWYDIPNPEYQGTSPYLGNWYGPYNGVDNDGDGVGDTSYTFENIVDNYPLINPFPFGASFRYTSQINVTFNSTSYHYLGGSFVNYSWDLGDGNTSYVPNFIHSYAEEGFYNVTLTVQDIYGFRKNITKEISTNPVIADFIYTIDEYNVTFQSTSYSNMGTITNYTWDLGDGTMRYQENFTYTYNKGGNYDVHLVVTDSVGNINDITKSIGIALIKNLNTGKIYNTISDAIEDNDTLDGHTIFVHNGTYFDEMIGSGGTHYSIYINKEINLIGEDKHQTIIDGKGEDHVLGVYVSNVTVSNFTFRNAQDGATICANMDHPHLYNSTISNCIVTDIYNWPSIWIGDEAAFGYNIIGEYNTIENCTVRNCGEYAGIMIYSSGAGILRHNKIINNKLDGNDLSILLFGSSNVNSNIVSDNIITNATGQYSSSIEISTTAENNIIQLNKISNDPSGGIYCEGYSNTITQNTILNCNYGLYINSNSNIFSNNLIQQCNISVRVLKNAQNNILYHNNFLNSKYGHILVEQDGANNTYYNPSTNEGNYWDDYDEPNEGAWDNDSNGIIDTQYTILNDNDDLFPLSRYYGSITNLDTQKVFIKIQSAIDDYSTNTNHTIFIKSGIYTEKIYINKSIHLIGQANNNSILDCKGKGDSLSINSDYTTISDFKIQDTNSQPDTSRIKINSNHNTICHNNLLDKTFGIYLNNSHNNNISQNNFYNNGIYTHQSQDNIINNNTINTKPLIYLEEQSNMTINDAGQVIILNCNNISLQGLELSDTNCAIFINNTKNSSCINNSIHDNDIGICLFNSRQNIFTINKIKDNKVGLISDSQSNNNTIYHNNFNNIITNAKDAGINHWNLSYPNGGNYWHDYSGKDIYHGPNNQYPDGEGIGDTPYPIINGINQDIYPLMNEWIGESTLQIPITTATPPIQIYNGYVNISCKVIGDISDLNSIYLYLHHPDGIQENKSVIQNQTYLTYYCNRTFSKNGTYTFNFWAIDTKGNIISSNIQYFWITSNYSIIELQSGNNVINITDEITISLNITQSTNMTYIGYYENPYPDAVRPPDTLDTYFNIAVDNESTILWPINITMYYIQHDLDESNVTENNLIGLFYWNETNEKWEFYNDTGVNTTDINNFAGYLWANAYHLTPIVSSGDITPPEILMINTNPNQQILGEYINITCIVEDNVNISQVQISIYDPSINNSNISMNPIPGTNTYYYTMKYFTPGQYTFSIWVCDGNRNGITSATHSFIILDVTSPSIQDHSISIAYTDDNFIFNTTVTDNIEVTTVTIEYWYEFNNHVIANMENINGNYWDKTILIENTLNHLFYYISSNDRSNNSDSNTIREIIIIDNKPPIINNTASVPSTQNIGEYLNISSNITDNIELEKIYLFIEYPDQHNENISIIQNKTNDIYFCNRTYPQPGIYTYHIWAADTSSNSNISTDYTFEITSFYNNPPYIPSSPDPENGETDVDVDYDLNWIGGDPDNDPVTYDVYFGTSGAPAMVVNNQSATIYNPGTMSYSTKYYWKIVSWDNHGASTTGPVWDFTTKSSYPPVFGTPSPANSSTNNSLSLTWSIPINDPEGDVFSWTIQCSNGQTISGSGASNGTKSLQLSGLAYSTTYKVWVNATDPTGSGLYTKKWYTFTTQQQQNVPPNKPNKPSGETNGKINTPYTYSTSTTDPNGDQVYYMWDWGDGMQSSWLGPYNSGVTINTTHTWTIKGSYSIKVKAKDTFGAESPWSDPFPITMPLDLVSGNTSLLKQLNQSPNVFPLLRQLLIR